MKSKNKKTSKLSLKECLQILINEDKNKVAEYFEKFVNAKRELYDVAIDCPVISQDIRQEIVGICSQIEDIMHTMEENGYVNRMDNPEHQFRSYDDLDESEEYPTYTQIRNVTGIYDNDMLNAAAEAERREELEGSIARDLGGYRDRKVLYFPDVCKLLKNKYGFEYERAYDEEQSHIFSNGNDELFICAEPYYPNQGTFKLRNLGVSEKY